MGALGFSIYFCRYNLVIHITICDFQGLFAPAMPQLYASARESINVSSSKDKLNLPTQYYVQCSHWAFYLVHLLVAQLIGLKGYAGLLFLVEQ